jgi:hypothetical protein
MLGHEDIDGRPYSALEDGSMVGKVRELSKLSRSKYLSRYETVV